jgi:outer membrane protein OmpA-like peptidoglycan-associated protein
MRRLWVLGLLAALGACSMFEPPNHRFVVFFQEWSAGLDDSARQVVVQAAAAANANSTLPVEVVGYADPEGSPQANRDLSRTRAQVVKDGLAAAGVAQQRISIQGRGSVGFSMDAQEARRVTIVVGAP